MVKKFIIIQVTDNNNSVNQQPPNPKSKFKTFSSTRPKKCPLCSTKNKITKEGSFWKCKVCEHIW